MLIKIELKYIYKSNQIKIPTQLIYSTTTKPGKPANAPSSNCFFPKIQNKFQESK